MNAFVQNIDLFYPLEAVLSIIGRPEKLAQNKLNIPKSRIYRTKYVLLETFSWKFQKK